MVAFEVVHSENLCGHDDPAQPEQTSLPNTSQQQQSLWAALTGSNPGLCDLRQTAQLVRASVSSSATVGQRGRPSPGGCIYPSVMTASQYQAHMLSTA